MLCISSEILVLQTYVHLLWVVSVLFTDSLMAPQFGRLLCAARSDVWIHTHSPTKPWQSCSGHSVCLIFFPGATSQTESIAGTQRPRGVGLQAESSVTLQSWHLVLLPNKHSHFSSSLALRGTTYPAFWAQDTSMENEPFEGGSGSFERRFSSRSVSQGCIYLWISARACIQECELAGDVIKEMPSLYMA